MTLSKYDVEVNSQRFRSRKYSVPFQGFFPKIFYSPFSKLQPNLNFPLFNFTIFLYNVHNSFIDVLQFIDKYTLIKVDRQDQER